MWRAGLQLITDYATEQRKKYFNAKQRLTGIACPKCTHELRRTSDQLLMSNPPQMNVECTNHQCDFTANIIAPFNSSHDQIP